MMTRFLLLLAVVLLALPGRASAEQLKLGLARIFGPNMVLQRDAPIVLRGTAPAGCEVTVSFAEKQQQVTADGQGRWQAQFPPMAAGGPWQITLAANGEHKNISNVLIGDVWFCSGQSNMAMNTFQCYNAEEEKAAAEKFPQLRVYMVKKRARYAGPQDDVEGQSWQVCAPKTIAYFSGLGYFFGRQLLQTLNIPIGIIDCSWGGTSVETWTPQDAFSHNQDLPLQADYKRVRQAMNDPAIEDPKRPHDFPGILYDSMVHPWVSVSIKGVLWYQGETNASRWQSYQRRFQVLIESWRERWKNPAMPFFFVQLSSFGMWRKVDPPATAESTWARIRSAQEATLVLPATGMTASLDVGDKKDIHPKDKQTVALRSANNVLAKVYGIHQKDAAGRNLDTEGPRFKALQRRDDALVLSFTNCTGGLTSRKNLPLGGFIACDNNGNEVPAQFQIQGEVVLVTSPQLKQIAEVRYAWADWADNATLNNAAGLPAGSFKAPVK